MPRTVQDYASAVPLGRVELPDYFRIAPDVTIQHVEARGDHVVATMLWDDYAHPVCHALLPEDVLLWGGDLPIDEASLDHWAKEAVVEFACAPELSLMESRRTSNGRVIELTEAEPMDPRYSGGHLMGTCETEEWQKLAQYADPAVPPPTVQEWRANGTLLAWHYLSLQHDRVLPVFGHGAIRWVSDGVASFDYLELLPGLPETFGVLTVAEAIHRAASAGAHTIICTVDVPGIELLGFQGEESCWEIDNRFVDIDYGGLTTFVSQTSNWTPLIDIQNAITRADQATYYAG